MPCALRRYSRGATQLCFPVESTLVRIPMICAALITGAEARRRLLSFSGRPPEPIHSLPTGRRSTVGGSLCCAAGELLFSIAGFSMALSYNARRILSRGTFVFKLFFQGRVFPEALYNSYHSSWVMVTSAARAISFILSGRTDPMMGCMAAGWRRIQAMARPVGVMP